MSEMRLRYLLAALLLAPLLMPVKAFAAADGAVCLLEPTSIVSRSPSGIDQVSNVETSGSTAAFLPGPSH